MAGGGFGGLSGPVGSEDDDDAGFRPGAPEGTRPSAPSWAVPETPGGQAPDGPAPHGQAPDGQPPYGQAPYGQAPYGQAPYGQAPYGQAPYGQGPYGTPGWGYPQGYQPPQLDKGARTSLILGIVGFLICGIILGPAAIIEGVKARKRIRESNGYLTGDGLALAGIILGAVVTVLFVIGMILIFSQPATPRSTIR